jgi:hypothetical protein
VASRYWVSLPGRGKAVEMTAAELNDRRKRGDIPAGTLISEFGSKEWVGPEKLDELMARAAPDDAGRVSTEAPPPSSAVQGADAVAAPPDLAPSLAGDVPPPKVVAPEPIKAPEAEEEQREPRSRTFVIVLASALVALLVSAGVFWAWFRYGYARGTVLEHVPADCRRLEYVDFAKLDASLAVRTHLARREKALQDWIEDLDDEDGFRRSQDDDAKGRASVVRTLKRLGLKPYGDVKEIAFCEIRENDETESLLVIGGTFRGRDLPVAIREAMIRRDRKVKDDRLTIDEIDGRPTLKLDENRVLMIANGQVAMIGKRKTIARYLPARPVGRSYGIRDDEVLVRHWAPVTEGATGSDERYAIHGDKLVVVRTWQKAGGDEAEVKAVKDRLLVAANRLRKLDGLDVLADSYENADVRLVGEEGRTEITWAMKDVQNAMGVIYDANRKEIRAISDAMRAGQGTEFFHHAVMPGVDYFELKLSPW